MATYLKPMAPHQLVFPLTPLVHAPPSLALLGLGAGLWVHSQVPLFLACKVGILHQGHTQQSEVREERVRCLFHCPVPLQLWSSVPTSTLLHSLASSGIKFPPGGT